MRHVSTSERDPARFAEALHHLTRDRDGTVTLTPSATSTVVLNPVITEESFINLQEMTANAADAKYTSPWCIAITSRGFFTITHANNAQTDRTFRWVAVGD